MRYVIAVNPISGRGRALRRARAVAALLERAGHAAHVAETRCGGDGERIAAEADADAVVACGGDGTLNEVLNGLAARSLPVGLIPAGTGNVVAKELGLARLGDRALAAVLGAFSLRPVDLGCTGAGRRFSFIASAGLDAAVTHRIAARRQGPLRVSSYLAATAAAWRAEPCRAIDVAIDGRPFVQGATFVAVVNMASYGGPLRLAPGARCDDGLLDVVALRLPLRGRLLQVFTAAFTRGIETLPDAATGRGAAVELAARDQVPLEIDGDAAGALPARFAVLPGAARFIVPAGGQGRLARLGIDRKG